MRIPFLRGLALSAVGVLSVVGCGNDSRENASPKPANTAVDLGVLAPRAGYGIYDASGGQCRLLAGHGLDDPVPVASAFKLWVLDAVARSIADGTLEWDTPVSIRDDLRSDPSGEVYHYPTGQQVSVSQLAESMISISDNTATDHLIDLVGRDAVSAVIRALAPDGASRTLPLLSTADMARLKFVHPDLGDEYAGLDQAARTEFLKTLPDVGPFPWPDDPNAINKLDLTTPSLIDDVDWFASGSDICRTMADLTRLSREAGLEPLDAVLSANPGLPPGQAGAWAKTWFKGGSEPGVVFLAYRLATADLDRVVVIALSNPGASLILHPEGQKIIEAILTSAQNPGSPS